MGEECEEVGKVDGECEDNAICTKPSDTAAPVCLKQCIDQSGCAATEACNGVSGSNIKACYPKT